MRRGVRRAACLDDDVGLLLLRLDVRLEVGLARVDGLLHILHRGATLGDVALRLPRELNLVGDVQVDAQVERGVDAAVVERVKALEDHDGRRGHLLVRVELAGDVVVDGLGHSLARLQVGDVRRHLVPVLALLVERGDAVGVLRVGRTARAVPLVVVVQADDRGHLRDERVGLTANVKHLRLAAEDGSQAAHEGRLAAARVGRHADDHRVLLHLHGRHARLRHARLRQHRLGGEGHSVSSEHGEHDSLQAEVGRGSVGQAVRAVARWSRVETHVLSILVFGSGSSIEDLRRS